MKFSEEHFELVLDKERARSDFPYFAEHIFGIKLTHFQKRLYQAIKAGNAASFLQKPMSPEKFARAVNQHLRKN